MSDNQNPDEQRASNPNQPLRNQEIKPQPITSGATCGHVWSEATSDPCVAGRGAIANRLSQHITNAAGVEQLKGFRLGELFSEVFKKHTDDEVEAYFTVGTAETIPNIIQVDTTWPRPWVFFQTFAGAMLVYVWFVQAWQNFHALNLIPGAIVVDSFVVSLSVLIFFFETTLDQI